MIFKIHLFEILREKTLIISHNCSLAQQSVLILIAIWKKTSAVVYRHGRFWTKLIVNVYLRKGVPPQDPCFLKNGQTNRVTNFSSTFRHTESDSEKKLVTNLDSRRGNCIWNCVEMNRSLFLFTQFQMQFPRLESRVVTNFFFRIGFSGSGSTRKFGNPVDLTVFFYLLSWGGTHFRF